jgi:Zn-dependent M28 family amino/carboxypeptidase
MKTKSSSLLPAFVLLMLICPSLSAQQTTSTASVTIGVTDQTGAVVPQAQIKISPLPATALGNLVTDQYGKFSIDLVPGNYDLSVTGRGFMRWTQTVQVRVAPSQTIDVVLKVGRGGGVEVQGATIDAVLNDATLKAGPDRSIVAQTHFDGQTWWSHIKVLADDKLEGRDTGSRGEREAQKYAAEQLKSAGAEPAGTDGFYQPVKFVSRQIVEKDCSLALIRDGKREPLTLGEDAIIGTRIMPTPEVEAPLVFAGYGLKVPEKNYDDFAGIDVRGKIVVIFSGSPSEIPGALASHYQTMAERWKVLRAAGAIGMVSLMNPAVMDIPWSRIALNRAHPTMDLDYPEFNETEGAKLAVTINPASAEKLFAGSGHTFEEIVALGKERKPLPHFPLTASISAKTKVEVTQVESANLVARFPGTDPALKDEYVVLSAHLDHIGIGEPINGDRIYNGAMDNGSGSALVLDLADSFKKHPEKLRRSLLLVLVTGEEKGLLGSKYFAAHPTVPAKSIVADINVDMFLPIVPLKILTVFGLDESDLGERTREIAQSFGVKVQPDPEPLRNVFIRSDQYNFIRHGVPSVMIAVGAEPGSPQQKIFKDWLTQRYHAPSDDVNQPVDLGAAAQYEEIVRALLLNVAGQDLPPRWKPDSFFRRYAEPAKIGAITITKALAIN